jgi:hypothetical protein
MKGYCPGCGSMDPFPRRRWLLYLAIAAASALTTLGIVLASR